MKLLSREAQDLIDLATATERPPPPDAVSRMRTGVLRRVAAAAGGAVVGTGAVAKAGAFGGSLVSHVLAVALGGAVLGLGTAVVVTTWSPSKPKVTVPAPGHPSPSSGGAPRPSSLNPPSRGSDRDGVEPSTAQPLARSASLRPDKTQGPPQALEVGSHWPAKRSLPRAGSTTPAPAGDFVRPPVVGSGTPLDTVQSPPAEDDPLSGEPTPLPPSSATESSPALAARSARGPAEAIPRTTPSSVSPGLALQLAILREVQASLRVEENARALELLNDKARLFEDSPLREEMSAARIAALCKLGKREEAQRDADSFLAAWPNSPHAKRVASGCRTPPPNRSTKP